MRWLPPLLISLALAGCLEPSQTLPTTLPADWNQGVFLLPYQMWGYHSGAHGADLYPTAPLERPTRCVAYRTDTHHDGDTCDIRDARHSRESEASWVIEPSWAGCPGYGMFTGCPEGSPVQSYEARVVAFDADNGAVAWWNGTAGPTTQYVTE